MVRTDFIESIRDKISLSNAQYTEMKRVLARTLTPINEYKEDFGKPTVIIGRDLEFDEVSIVQGVIYDS